MSLVLIAVPFEEMIKFYENVNNIRSSLNYDIDGVVYKVNDINKHEKIGKPRDGQNGL